MISLLVGLGNIGERYAGTRHNVGFDILDRVAASLNAPTPRQADLYAWSAAEVDGRRVLMAWPSTLMNRSGRAFAALLERHQLAPDECLVIVDDFNLPLGSLRFRPRGSDGGHNGLASIIDHLQSEDFPRLRIGIGPLVDNQTVTEFVLGRFEPSEIELARETVAVAAEATEYALSHRLEEAMSRYNRTNSTTNSNVSSESNSD
ncbi:aminoacyl-tRNA hydrolase [candidate division GN15 bacterium]|nr:aminoacyl-tRNA hydrolase [candidate division GN15 bacterium]